MNAVSWRRGTTCIMVILGAAFMLSWPALAEVAKPAKETLELALRALRESSFTAHITVRTPDGEEPRELVELVLYRRPPDEVRLEPVPSATDEEGSWYVLEKGGRSLRLIADRKEVLVVGKPRVSPIFTMVQMFLDRGCRRSELAVVEVPAQERGKHLVRIYAPGGHTPFELVVDTQDYLPRLITMRPSTGRRWMAVALSEVEVVPADGFAPEFFEVPPNWRVIGLPGPLGEPERERLKRFRTHMPGPRSEASGRPLEEHSTGDLRAPRDAEEVDEAKRQVGDFLPLIPTHLPVGFTGAEAHLLFFRGNLVYHLQLVNPDERQLISIFEARGPGFLRETEHLDLPERIGVERRLMEHGIFVLVLSSAVDKKELKAIADSLTYDPECARKLVSQAIDRALGENEQGGE